MEIEFKKLRKKDEDFLEDFLNKLDKETKKNWSDFRDSKDVVAYIFSSLNEGEKIKGINKKGEIICFGQLSSFDSKKGFISGIVVRSDLQRKGIGTQIMKYLEDLALKKNLKILELDVFLTNKKAIKFYEKIEYKKFGKSFLFIHMRKVVDPE